MKRKERDSAALPALGGSSLLVIFAVLCLVVFALLSLTTVQAEKRLSDDARDMVAAYYHADLQAQEIFARLRLGEEPAGVSIQEGRYAYECAFVENQRLVVELEKDGENWRILRWQDVARGYEIDDTLVVWDGAQNQK